MLVEQHPEFCPLWAKHARLKENIYLKGKLLKVPKLALYCTKSVVFPLTRRLQFGEERVSS